MRVNIILIFAAGLLAQAAQATIILGDDDVASDAVSAITGPAFEVLEGALNCSDVSGCPVDTAVQATGTDGTVVTQFISPTFGFFLNAPTDLGPVEFVLNAMDALFIATTVVVNGGNDADLFVVNALLEPNIFGDGGTWLLNGGGGADVLDVSNLEGAVDTGSTIEVGGMAVIGYTGFAEIILESPIADVPAPAPLGLLALGLAGLALRRRVSN